MSKYKKDYSLKEYNTFNIDVKTKHFIAFHSETELKEIINSDIYKKNKTFVLGGGSNILLTKNFNGLILHNKIEGIHILEDNEKFSTIEVGSGVNWHQFVKWSITKELSGIENLALIPGTVGASPIQNIGAYGMEVKDSITKVYALEIKSKKSLVFKNKECQFKYRNSIFKTKLKDKVIITKVEFKLFKTPRNETSYGAVEEELKKLKLKPSPKSIATAVINIRNRKLPNPAEIGNSGSFFKNPIVTIKKFTSLKKEFPNIVGYKLSASQIKIAAGWLIENAGLKGYRKGDAGVHKKQALVLVNYEKATGNEIADIANKIQKTIFKKYGIRIEPEVNIL